jgi:nucleoside-diphosphate-sugar epimerase
MNPQKVLITGASGFIGTRLCERLHLYHRTPFRAGVRNFGNAARIARLGAEMAPVNLLKAETVEAALEGCDAVVHLAHGDDAEAPRATQNLIQACQKAGIRRFVHVSSMSVHGPSPGPECAVEESATIGRYGESYCDSKAEEERLVQAAISRDHFPAVVLRPTVVYGPHSAFVLQVAAAAKLGSVSLIDNGAGICNAVYVDDVCGAIYAALNKDRALGCTMFINGDERITWEQFTSTFARLINPNVAIRSISGVEAERYWRDKQPTFMTNISAARSLLASTQFHRQLSTVPAVGTLIRLAKTRTAQLLREERVAAIRRRSILAAASPLSAPSWPNLGRVKRETVRVQFRNNKAKEFLEWAPRYDFQRGVKLTNSWLEFARLTPGDLE